ncbi:hypothetical protein IAR50_002790 [Cryptococcus sp. DSM 104548]
MQRKALKQLGKVTQWTSEKVFSGEKTNLSEQFLETEKEIEVRRIGIERLHATSLPFYEQLTKAKATADPYPPPGSGKDKISYTEALGLVMIDYGEEIAEDYGDALSKYGRARCRLASVQEEFASRMSDSYIAGMESALAAVNEYKTLRKKLDSRRLALDATITKAQNSKKDAALLEEDIELAKTRFQEVEEETHSRMIGIQEAEEEQYALLSELLDSELEYHAKCREILEDLRHNWGSHGSRKRTAPKGRSRSNTATSTRSLGRTAITRSHSSKHNTAPPSSEEETQDTVGRARSQSNASNSGKSKEKRSMLPSFGSLGRKSGLSNVTPKKEKKSKKSESRAALHSEEEEEEEYRPMTYSSPRADRDRDRSQSQLSSVLSYNSSTYDQPPPSLRRTFTSPPTPDTRYPDPSARYVKALYDYQANKDDELGLRVGMVIKVETEVNDDWWIGESEGRSGLFPKTYTEEHVPSPEATMPRRHLPPPIHQPVNNHNVPPSPNLSLNDSEFESEAESTTDGFYDHDHNFTAPLSQAPQPQAALTPARANPVTGKKAPAPPPSRRAQSSSNILDLSKDMGETYLSPPRAGSGYGRQRSGTATAANGGTVRGGPGASPFAGGDD